MKKLEKFYIADFISATKLKENRPYSDWRKNKYVNHQGLFLLVFDSKRNIKYVVFYIINNDKEVLYTQGLISSQVHEFIEDLDNSKIIVRTKRSEYFFCNVTEDVPNEYIFNIPRLL